MGLNWALSGGHGKLWKGSEPSPLHGKDISLSITWRSLGRGYARRRETSGKRGHIHRKIMLAWMRSSRDEEKQVFGISDQPVMAWVREDRGEGVVKEPSRGLGNRTGAGAGPQAPKEGEMRRFG